MDPRSRLRQAQAFKVYYGTGTPESVVETGVVIVEPSAHLPETIAEWRSKGQLVIAYISVIEVPTFDSFHCLLKEEDWLRVNGELVTNEAYGNPLADLRSKRWVGLLHHRIGQLLHIGGYDGVFMDTIGNVEWAVVSSLRPALLQAAADLVRGVRELYPDRIIIQNNGVEHLCGMTAPWIDAICWENPLFFKPHAAWSHAVAERLAELGRLPESVRTMLLFESGEEARQSMPEANRLAQRYGWMICVEERNYI